MEAHESMFGGMDGADAIPKQVSNIRADMVDAGYVLAGDGVDAAVAMILEDSEDVFTALQHVAYVIRQLQHFQTNLAASACRIVRLP